MAQMIIAASREDVKSEIVRWIAWHGKRHDTEAATAGTKAGRTAAAATAEAIHELASELAQIPVVKPEGPLSPVREDWQPTLSVRLNQDLYDQVKVAADAQGVTARTFARNAIKAEIAKRRLTNAS